MRPPDARSFEARLLLFLSDPEFHRSIGMNWHNSRERSMPATTTSLQQRPCRCATSHRPAPVRSGSVWVQGGSVGLIALPCMPIVQAKLRIIAPNDKYEQEADRIANQVVRMPDPKVAERNGLAPISLAPRGSLSRECNTCSSGEDLCPNCEQEEKLRRKERGS